MNYDIITIGSASVDVFVHAADEERVHRQHSDLCYPLGDKILIDKLNIMIGGGGVNSAVGFSRLGLKTGYIGVVGSDTHGDMILETLHREHVTFLGSIQEGMSGYSVILQGTNDRTILTYKGVNNEITQLYNAYNTHWLYIGTVMGKSEESVFRLVREAQRRGIHIGVNLSSYEARQGLKKLSSYLRCVDVLILNKEESQVLCGKKESIVIAKLLKKYVKKCVVITNGIKPIIAYDGTKIYLRKVTKIKAVSTTGAGDAFAVGFMYGILHEASIDQALAYGIAESGAVIKHIGAQQGLLRRL